MAADGFSARTAAKRVLGHVTCRTAARTLKLEDASMGLRFEGIQRRVRCVKVWMFERRKDFRNGGSGDNKCCPTE